MKLSPAQIKPHLNKELASMYLVHGNEPLLIYDACEAIISAVRRNGIEERIVFHSDQDNWDKLQTQSDSQSLFASRKLLHVRLWNGTLKGGATRALSALADADRGEDIALIQADALKPATLKTTWFKKLRDKSVEVQALPVPPNQLTQWIQQRAEDNGIELTEEGARLLAMRTEGNLVSAAQEILKIAICQPQQPVGPETLQQSVGDHSDFSAYAMVDAALAGKLRRAMRMHWRLMHTGTTAYQLIWTWHSSLMPLQSAVGTRGSQARQTLIDAGAWPNRCNLLLSTLERCDAETLHTAINLLATADAQCKGAARGNVWHSLADLCALISGVDIPWQSVSEFTPPWHPRPAQRA